MTPTPWINPKLWADPNTLTLTTQHNWTHPDHLPPQSVAIIGARHATPYGLDTATQLARTATQAGKIIISGGARGIDYTAHSTALTTGGHTIAIIGAGLHHTPTRLRPLRAQGLGLLSPLDPHHRGAPWAFPKRNEHIAELCGTLIVAEATLTSGALMTARAALKKGREVWVALGRLGEASHMGCYALLDEGARALSSERAWLKDPSPHPPQPHPPQPHPPQPHPPLGAPPPSALLQTISADPTHIEELALRAHLPLPAAMAEAALLELDGWIIALPGGRYARAPTP
jgi:DNA processing protein